MKLPVKLLGCVTQLDRHFTVRSVRQDPRNILTAREASRHMPGSHGTLPAIAAGTADRSPAVPVEDPSRKACTPEDCRVHSACAGTERPQPRRGKVGGRARRRALCARCSRLVWQVSPRAARHARTHEYIMHHTAWTACSPHVLEAAGRQWSSQTMEYGYL